MASTSAPVARWRMGAFVTDESTAPLPSPSTSVTTDPVMRQVELLGDVCTRLEKLELAIVQSSSRQDLPEGMGCKEAAEFIGVSLRTFHEMNRTGRLPSSGRAGDRLPIWSRTELRAWIIAGMPVLSEWEKRRALALQRVA